MLVATTDSDQRCHHRPDEGADQRARDPGRARGPGDDRRQRRAGRPRGPQATLSARSPDRWKGTAMAPAGAPPGPAAVMPPPHPRPRQRAGAEGRGGPRAGRGERSGAGWGQGAAQPVEVGSDHRPGRTPGVASDRAEGRPWSGCEGSIGNIVPPRARSRAAPAGFLSKFPGCRVDNGEPQRIWLRTTGTNERRSDGRLELDGSGRMRKRPPDGVLPQRRSRGGGGASDLRRLPRASALSGVALTERIDHGVWALPVAAGRAAVPVAGSLRCRCSPTSVPRP